MAWFIYSFLSNVDFFCILYLSNIHCKEKISDILLVELMIVSNLKADYTILNKTQIVWAQNPEAQHWDFSWLSIKAC